MLEPVGEDPCPSAVQRLNTDAAITTFPHEVGPEQLDSDRMYKTAFGSLVPDGGPLVFHGYDEQGP